MTNKVDGVAMTCEEARGLLLTRPDEDTLSQTLTLHLEDCDVCGAFQASHRGVDLALSHVLVSEPPAWLTASIMREVTAPPPVPWWSRPRVNLALQWSLYTAIAAVLMVGLLTPQLGLALTLESVPLAFQQLLIALDVLVSVWTTLPLDALVEYLDDSPWLYEAGALLLVVWWLQSGRETSDRQRGTA